MEPTTWILVLAFVFGFGLLSRRLGALGLSAPMVFVGFGVVCGERGFGLIAPDHEHVHLLAELTLMLVLFGDAARIDLRALRREAGLPLRLLGIGMPLTILLGAGLAELCFPSLSLWEAGLLAAVLAPTDAALGQAVVSSEEVPQAIRQALNVESGLNDGIALPIVMVFAAVAGIDSPAPEDEALQGSKWLTYWLAQVGLGPLAGLVVAFFGGRAATFMCERGWMGETFERLAGVSLAALSYFVALAIGGNGFISAFVAGMVLGNTSSGFAAEVSDFLETEGQLLMIAVFMLFGAVVAYDTVRDAPPMAWVYAIASLTVIRMVPVAISMIGRGLRWPTTLFLGWFGPRGLATVLFALLVVDRDGIASRELVVIVAMLTVVLSVVAHGVSAGPAARIYGRWAKALADEDLEMTPVVEHPMRILHGRSTKAPS